LKTIMSTNQHLTEDDLVLHFYGELDGPTAGRAEQHLSACRDCRDSFVRLQHVMAAVDAMPEPVLPDGFERVVWARLEPALAAPRRRWFSWLALTPAPVALAATVVVLVTAAFFAGRVTREEPAATAASTAELRERVLLADVGEHLDRSQMMLVDLVSADPAEIDMRTERQRAEELVAANRLYRQTAAATGEARIEELLDELERLLVELAASPDQLSTEEMGQVRERLDANGLLFKVRVLSSTLRERQKKEIRARAGQSS
jgi:hypothetical protein